MKNQKENKGRTIGANDSRLAWLVSGLHARLEHYGDIGGIQGKAKVRISVENSYLKIEVDRDCRYDGYHNYNKGTLTKRACELALKSMLISDLMWVSIPRKNPTDGRVIIDNTGELRGFYPTARQLGQGEAMWLYMEYEGVWDEIRSLPDTEKAEIYKFLD